MHVDIIQMDPRIARVHYSDYMKRCRQHREEREKKRRERAKELGKEMRRIQIEKTQMELEDRKLLSAYKALMKGQRLIHLPTVIRDGGFNDKDHWFPRLAIATADAKEVSFSCWGPSFTSLGRPWGLKGKAEDAKIPHSMFPAEVTNRDWRTRNNHPLDTRALVPAVPPNLRPDELHKYHILWEAEWKHRAPGDPILLSRVNSEMFAIVAQWDLTPLEQKILEGRT